MQRVHFFRSLMFGVLFLFVVQPAIAVEIPPKQHPWGRFKAGSWQRVRVTTETLGADESKQVEIKFITTRLVKVEADGITLVREVKLGEQTTRQKPVKYAWDGSQWNDETKEKLSLGEVQLEGKTYACQTHLVTTKAGDTTTVTKSWYSPDFSPYFLKRLIRLSGKRRQHTAMEVTKFVVPKKVLDKNLACWETKTIVVDSKSKKVTTTHSSMQIPGGVVLSKSEVFDKQSASVQNVSVELDAFEVAR